MSLPKGNLSVSIWSFGSIEFRRRFAKASTKTASKGKTKKKTQKTGRPQPLPKITDPKIESKLTQCLDLFEKIKAPDHEMTEEELNVAAQIAKEYSRQKMFQHRLWQSDMIMKERLTRSAILALPPHLRYQTRHFQRRFRIQG